VSEAVTRKSRHGPRRPAVPVHCARAWRRSAKTGGHHRLLADSHRGLKREWEEHDIAKYVKVIAGQEMGTKGEHLGYAMDERWAPDHVLNDRRAPGDLKAARANKCLFYP